MQTTRNRKIIPTIIIGMLSLLSSSLVSSQTQGPDIVELKNGQIRQGTIVEQRPGHFLKLWQTPSDDTLTLQYSDIESLRIIPQEEIRKTEGNLESSLNIMMESKFNHNTNSIIIPSFIGRGEWDSWGYGIGILRKLTPRIQAGISSSFHNGRSSSRFTSVSLLGEFKYVARQSHSGRISLLLSCALGPRFFIFPRYTESSGNAYLVSNGAYVNPSMGCRINFTQNTGLILDLGFQYMRGKKRKELTIAIVDRYYVFNTQLKATFFF